MSSGCFELQLKDDSNSVGLSGAFYMYGRRHPDYHIFKAM